MPGLRVVSDSAQKNYKKRVSKENPNGEPYLVQLTKEEKEKYSGQSPKCYKSVRHYMNGIRSN